MRWVALVVVLALLSWGLTLAASGHRRLDRAATIQGVPCTAGAKVTEDGRLRRCRLSAAWQIKAGTLPRDTVVFFNEEDRLDYCFLHHDMELQGHRCRGKGHGFMTTFHPDGALKLCWLAEPERIDGIPCRRTSIAAEIFGGLLGRPHSGVQLYDNGRLESCRLAEDLTLDGVDLHSGQRVEFDRSGVLVRGK